MNDLIVDAQALEELKDAIGLSQLRDDFLTLVQYCHELHGMVERLAGEPVTEAEVAVMGSGNKLTIQRNISRLNIDQLKSIPLPKSALLVQERVGQGKVGTILSSANE